MKKGKELLAEWESQDLADKDYIKLYDMIDMAIKEAVNEKLDEAIELVNAERH